MKNKISILITKECSLDCNGCYLSEREKGGTLSLNKAKKIANLLKGLGLKAVTISGGDPFCAKDGFKIIDTFLDAFEVNVDTVGLPLLSGLNEKEEAMLGKIRYLGIPLDGYDEESSALFRRGVDAIYSKNLAVLSLLSALRIPVSVNTVVHAGNVKDLGKIYNIITGYSCVRRWELHQFYLPSVHKDKHFAQMAISDEIFESGFKSVEHIKGKIKVDLKHARKKGNFVYINQNGSLIATLDGTERDYGSVLEIDKRYLKELLSGESRK